MLDKIRKCFHTTDKSTVYGRTIEIERIKAFVHSKETILHITGSPGTGKTCTTKAALSDFQYLYLNYYNQPAIGKLLKSSDSNLIVVDEFDKYFQDRKTECIRNIQILQKQNKKLITISNNLRMGNLKFKPYSTEDIVSILKEKIQAEIGGEIIEEKCLKFIAKKFDKIGDLRLVFKYILDAFSAMSTPSILKISDLAVKTESTNIKSIHHDLINTILQSVYSKELAFAAYIKECRNMNIQAFDRNDFQLIFDIYK